MILFLVNSFFSSKLQNTKFIAILNKIQVPKYCFENLSLKNRPQVVHKSCSGRAQAVPRLCLGRAQVVPSLRSIFKETHLFFSYPEHKITIFKNILAN